MDKGSSPYLVLPNNQSLFLKPPGIAQTLGYGGGILAISVHLQEFAMEVFK